jgi:sterol desaturase/sphingolipid hydroxylase (fatty acid hydroxylase superfamily)
MTRHACIMASRVNYWLGLALDLVCSVTALVAGFACSPHVGASFAALAAGSLWYTLCEYVIHRWLYHRGNGVMAILHDGHHAEPAALVGAPFYYSLSVVALHGVLAAVIAGVPLALVFAGALLFGYFQQSLIHHSAHRLAWLDVLGARSRLRRHHALHHCAGAINFGVSTALWDRVFGTLG